MDTLIQKVRPIFEGGQEIASPREYSVYHGTPARQLQQLASLLHVEFNRAKYMSRMCYM